MLVLLLNHLRPMLLPDYLKSELGRVDIVVDYLLELWRLGQVQLHTQEAIAVVGQRVE